MSTKYWYKSPAKNLKKKFKGKKYQNIFKKVYQKSDKKKRKK